MANHYNGHFYRKTHALLTWIFRKSFKNQLSEKQDIHTRTQQCKRVNYYDFWSGSYFLIVCFDFHKILKIKYHTTEVSNFFASAKAEYASVKYISPEEDSQEYEAKAEAMYLNNLFLLVDIRCLVRVLIVFCLQLIVTSARGIIANTFLLWIPLCILTIQKL